MKSESSLFSTNGGGGGKTSEAPLLRKRRRHPHKPFFFRSHEKFSWKTKPTEIKIPWNSSTHITIITFNAKNATNSVRRSRNWVQVGISHPTSPPPPQSMRGGGKRRHSFSAVTVMLVCCISGRFMVFPMAMCVTYDEPNWAIFSLLFFCDLFVFLKLWAVRGRGGQLIRRKNVDQTFVKRWNQHWFIDFSKPEFE